MFWFSSLFKSLLVLFVLSFSHKHYFYQLILSVIYITVIVMIQNISSLFSLRRFSLSDPIIHLSSLGGEGKPKYLQSTNC